MTSSYVHGASEVPLKYLTIGQAFDEIAGRFAGRDALIVTHQNIRWSYAELADRVEAIATGLLALGLEPGERLGIWAPNCSEWVLTQLASAKAGLILVNVNPAYRQAELEFCLRAVGCRALVTADRLKSSDYLGMLRTLMPELEHCEPGKLHSAALPALRSIIRLGGESTRGCLNFNDLGCRGDEMGRRLEAMQAEIQPDDAANIQFTSGTTGQPKGATLSHVNLLNNGYFVGRGMRLSEHDRICVPVPLYHCFGMVMGNLAAISHGAAMIYPAESFDAARTLEVVAHERATALYGVPEEVCAWIQLKAGVTATEAEIRDYCRDRIAHYKIPRYIRFVDEFPLTITGKVQRFVMRDG